MLGRKSLAVILSSALLIGGTGLAYAASGSDSASTAVTAQPSLFPPPATTTLVTPTPAPSARKAARAHHKGTQFKHLSKSKKLSKVGKHSKHHTAAKHKKHTATSKHTASAKRGTL